MDNIIKNPTFIAVVAGVIAYSYVVWIKKKDKKDKKNKKNKKDDKDNNEILTAGIVFAITWLLMYGYINYKDIPNNMNRLNIGQTNIQTYKLVKDVSDSPKSFTLINPTGGISMPMACGPIPDVFINNF